MPTCMCIGCSLLCDYRGKKWSQHVCPSAEKIQYLLDVMLRSLGQGTGMWGTWTCVAHTMASAEVAGLSLSCMKSLHPVQFHWCCCRVASAIWTCASVTKWCFTGSHETPASSVRYTTAKLGPPKLCLDVLMFGVWCFVVFVNQAYDVTLIPALFLWSDSLILICQGHTENWFFIQFI